MSDQDLRDGGDDLRTQRTEPLSPVASLDRRQQLKTLLTEFLFSVDQAAKLLRCTPNTIYTRRQKRHRPERHTALDDRIDLVYFVASSAASDGLEPPVVRDWLFSRCLELDGSMPADLLAEGEGDEVLGLLKGSDRERIRAQVDRQAQLNHLNDHFLLSVEQLCDVLSCSANTVHNRRGRPRPERHTDLDARIDEVSYVMVGLEEAGFAADTARDWLFGRSRYFDGDKPAVRLSERHWRLVLIAGKCFTAGLSAQDFAEYLEDLGVSDGIKNPPTARVHAMPQIA